MLKKISLIFFFMMAQPLTAQATFLFTPSVTYVEQNQEVLNLETDAKLTIIDLRFGYVFDMGLYVGGLYSIQDYDLLIESSDSFFGPSVGYYNSGFLIVGHYYLYGEKDLGDGSGKYSKVSGFQLDVSYSLPINSTVYIGPQLTYTSYTFDELEVNGFTQTSEYKFSGVTPYINLSFVF